MIDTPETQHDISIEELEEVDPKVLFSNLQQSTKLLIKSQMMRKQMISTIFSLKPTQTLMLFAIQHKNEQKICPYIEVIKPAKATVSSASLISSHR